MPDDDITGRTEGRAALQLVIGLLAVLKAKHVLTQADLDGLFDAALFGAETEQSEVNDRVRRVLERMASQIAALPTYEAGPQSPPSSRQ